jgi:hypothetical protein
LGQPNPEPAVVIFLLVLAFAVAVLLMTVLLFAFGVFGGVLALVGLLFGRIEARNERPRSWLSGCLAVGGTVTAAAAFTLLGLLLAALRSG